MEASSASLGGYFQAGDVGAGHKAPRVELALKMSLGSGVIPGLSHTVRDKEMWLRATRCLSVKTP